MPQTCEHDIETARDESTHLHDRRFVSICEGKTHKRGEPLPTVGACREMNAVQPLVVTAEHAAKMLGISRSNLYTLLSSGELKSIKIGASRRIPIAAIHELIEKSTVNVA